MQKNIFLGAVMVLGLISINTAAWAQEESATRQECVAQVTQVVDRIKAEGFDAVAATITPGGPYSWKADGYVFCMDAGGDDAGASLSAAADDEPSVDELVGQQRQALHQGNGGIGPKRRQGLGDLYVSVSRQPGNAIKGDLSGESPKREYDCGCRVFPSNRLETAMTRREK